MSEESGAGLLTLEELAEVADGDALHTQERRDRLAHVICTDPRFAEQLERLEQLARDAGLGPEWGSYRGVALEENEDFDRLLATDTWRDPAEVLDPDGDRGFSYDCLISIAKARAARAEDPAVLEAVQERLEQAWAVSRGEVEPGEGSALTELEHAVLGQLVSGRRSGLDDLVDWVRWHLEGRAHKRGAASAVERSVVLTTIRHLQARGYAERKPWTGDDAPVRVTPLGVATAVVHGRERRNRRRRLAGKQARKLKTSLPESGEIGSRMEDLSIDFLDLSLRARNALKRSAILTAGALAGLTRKQLFGLQGIARKSVEEIEFVLATVGLELAS